MSNSAQFGILNSFDHSIQTWKTYKGRVCHYFVANDINGTTDPAGKKRKAILLSALAEGTYKLASDLALPKDIDDVPYEDILTLLDNHFTPKQVGFGERHNFYAAAQLAGETYSQWAARLRGLTEKCGFLNVEEALRDKFIMGMQPGREKEKLYAKDLADLTLVKVVELAESMSRARSAAVSSSQATSQPENQLFKISNGGNSRSVGKVKCEVCGYTNHKSSECRFANYICKKCHVKGHLRKMCKKVNYVEMDCSDKGEDDEGDDVSLESRPANRKRSYTQSDADDARVKRKRLADGMQLSVDRLSRPRTSSASAKLAEPTTPSKKPVTPKKSEVKLPRTKLPNFAALHQKQFSKMESLDECQERKARRAKQLLTPTGAVNMLERISPKDKAVEPEKPKEAPEKPKEDPKKPETPIKSLPTFKSLNPGYTRFGFKLNLDVNPFSIPSKAQPKPKDNKPNGLTRQPTLPSLTGATSIRREVAKQTVMREKSFTDRRSVKRTENRTVIKGVRTNRRFELQMRMRDI